MLESDELAFNIKDGIVYHTEITIISMPLIMNKNGLFVFTTTL